MGGILHLSPITGYNDAVIAGPSLRKKKSCAVSYGKHYKLWILGESGLNLNLS